jgi:hypothetical protein
MANAIIDRVGFLLPKYDRAATQGRCPAYPVKTQYLVLALPDLIIIRL